MNGSSPTPSTEVDKFLQKFLPTKSGRPSKPEAVVGKIKFWISVANDPVRYYPTADPYELRIRRRNARQAVRRLVKRHPEVLAALSVEVAAEEVAQ